MKKIPPQFTAYFQLSGKSSFFPVFHVMQVSSYLSNKKQTDLPINKQNLNGIISWYNHRTFRNSNSWRSDNAMLCYYRSNTKE